jgi:hypothetical protein
VILAALLFLDGLTLAIGLGLLWEIRSSRQYRRNAIALMDDRLTVDLYDALRDAVVAQKRRERQGKYEYTGKDSHDGSFGVVK